MLVGEPTSRRTAKASRKALRTIGGLDLNTERSQHVDTPGSTRAAVLRPLGHGSRNVAVDEPVAALNLLTLLTPRRPYSSALMDSYIVIIPTGADTVNDKGADLLDAGKLRCRTHSGL